MNRKAQLTSTQHVIGAILIVLLPTRASKIEMDILSRKALFPNFFAH